MFKLLFAVGVISIIAYFLTLKSKKKSNHKKVLKFSTDDVGYGFSIEHIDFEAKTFLIRFLINIQDYHKYARTQSAEYSTEGIDAEMLKVGGIFKILPVNDSIEFQKVLIESGNVNSFDGVELKYAYTKELYQFDKNFLDKESAYKENLFDIIAENF